MKMKKLLNWVLVLILALTPFSALAQDDYHAVADGILAFAANGDDVQKWLDETVSPAAGSTMDYYVLLLNRFGDELSYSEYVRCAAPLLEAGAISNPVTRQKCALSVIACGAADMVPEGIADETIGKLGVMSYVYGLHLLNNGVSSSQWTIEAVLEKLLALQKEDGGWAVMGQYGDTDVTAMCIQALACNRGNNMRIIEAINRALTFLSEKQLDNGGFIGTGKENSESCAQVIVALSSLGLDACTDERFMKNDVSVMDAMMQYRMADGGFAHLPGDTASNENASVQALQALYSYLHKGERFFDFSGIEEKEYELPSERSWKFYAWIVIGALCTAGVIFALTRKRGRAMQLIFVLLSCAIATVAVYMINIQSASDYYGEALPTGNEVAGQAYISIRCDTVAGSNDDGSTPDDGVILERTAIPFREGASVFDVLTSAARTFRIQTEHSGGEGGMAYVTGINYLYEYAYGDLSGWIYSVNGETFSIGCGSYIVKDDDDILWQYTTKLGEDLK